jgi:hypothetical protein
VGQGTAMAEQYEESVCDGTQLDWQTYASGGVGADDIRRHHSNGILPRRPSRPMSRALYHGRRIHRLWNCDDYDTSGWPALVAKDRSKSRIL